MSSRATNWFRLSTVNESRYGVGSLELPTLAALRRRIEAPNGERSTVSCVTGEARAMHLDLELAGALFQVASQFNLLEMTGPSVTPEHGVTCYSGDATQGPACAIAAGAATIYRNYFAPVGDEIGQTRERQLDALAPLGAALSAMLNRPVGDLWDVRNGYTMCTADGLDAISELLAAIKDEMRDELRGQLMIGLHRGMQRRSAQWGNGSRPTAQRGTAGTPKGYADRFAARRRLHHLRRE